MNISLAWLNQYLQPTGVSADDAQRALIEAGFPIESRETLVNGDVKLDVEITSNRGDCLSHIGLAREVAAKTGRALVLPVFDPPPTTGGLIADALILENPLHDVCPLFTARVIQGLKVGPSPDWLVKALEAVGQRSINNVVDVTNFITFDFGNPCHVFDLKKLAGATLKVRWAKDNEPLITLDGKKRVLRSDELVVADAERAQSLAGVIGGQESEVDASTTDVVFEMATWDPVTVRRAARRLQVRTDAGHRFERIVDARTIEFAARRAVAMIVKVAGGKLCEGVLSQGQPPADATDIRLRPARVQAIMGTPVEMQEIAKHLRAVGVEVEPIGRTTDAIRCIVPAHRPDLTREIDLIEEIARLRGLESIPTGEMLPVRVSPPQPSEVAMREVGAILIGQGFFETVTFSFVGRKHAQMFKVAEIDLVEVDDERRGEEPVLRPSIIPSLLVCRRANQDAGARPDGGVRLFEFAATFGQTLNHETKDAAARNVKPSRPGVSVEHRHLGLLIDVPNAGPGSKVGLAEKQAGVRALRGAIESICRAVAGPVMPLDVVAMEPPSQAFEPAAFAGLKLGSKFIGTLGLVSAATLKELGLEMPVVAAELHLESLLTFYPPRTHLTPLPAFPAIERDLSLIVGEAVTWATVAEALSGAHVQRLEATNFVGTYRGTQVGAGKKSMTLRMRFRDPSRTLRHEEVDPQVASVVELMKQRVGAEVRTV